MKELAKVYIEKRIQTTRTKDTDYTAAILSNNSGKSQAEHAQDWAQEGQPTLTASYLNQDTALSVSQKGGILAEAYTQNAERTENLARYTAEHAELAASYRREAQQLKKIALGLTRAAKRSQNS